ncbi:13998_t:CDS:1 [Acaulospora colombiana]|uniref:13998_t:CDS:1 n=1 Tax=Acaulospora colombiana TaxID=27376 RepID=A0ACA9LKJ9_9GLOM|nr:13998_t:CDS:1 [Acaulospora colombiana]
MPEIYEGDEYHTYLREILDNDNLYISRRPSSQLMTETDEVKVCIIINGENGLKRSLKKTAKLSEIRIQWEEEQDSLYMGSNCYFVDKNGIKIDPIEESKEILIDNLNRGTEIGTLNILLETNKPDWVRLTRMCENGFIIKCDEDMAKDKVIIEKAPKQVAEIKIDSKDTKINTDEGFYEEELECHNEIEDICKRNPVTSASVPAATP